MRRWPKRTRDLLKREEMRRAFGGILDLERLLARISLDSAGPRDVRALAASLARLPGLKTALDAMTAPQWRAIAARLDTLDDVTARIVKTLVAEPPLTLVDGGAIAAGVDAELDELRTISTTGRQAIAAIEDRERQRTGIGSLKVRYNSVFGYYIEITKANLALAPADYERKQTLVNAERFTTPELKEYERKILTAHDRSIEIEKRIFAELRKIVLESAGRIRRSSAAVAEADLLANFAHLAAVRRYVRPQLTDEPVLEAVAARHPVIEQWMEETREGRFIANDLYLNAGDEGPSLLLITGPNMGGKSTYLRQAAMLVLMAQMGSFVPAESLRLGLGRPHLYAHRRQRQRGARPLDLHGGDDGDGDHSEYGDAAIADSARRDGPRHGDLRRAEPGLGDGGVSARRDGRAHAVCHALSRADDAGREAAARAQSARGREGRPRAASCFCTTSSPARPARATALKWRGWPDCLLR